MRFLSEIPKRWNPPQHLTDRQREVLQMLAEGRSLREIAIQLQISYRTVRFHKGRIMEELGISKNAELVKYAMKHGMISPVWPINRQNRTLWRSGTASASGGGGSPHNYHGLHSDGRSPSAQ